MALQGTIDAFALADVLRLLNASSKSGRLIVNGDRGSASLWIADGAIVGGSTSSDPHNPEPVDVVFDVLRYQHGSFIFENDARCPNPNEALPLLTVLEQAEAGLAEWLEIIRVVPSTDSVVVLAEELPHPEVVVDQACWTSIVAVGSGTTVDRLGATLGLSELPVCRLVRALVAAGFVEVAAPGSLTDAPVVEDTVADATPADAEPETTSFESTSFEDGFSSNGYDSTSFGQAESATDVVYGDGAFSEASAGGDAAYSSDSFGSGSSFDDQVADPGITISGLTDDPFAPEAFGSFDSETSAADGEAEEEDWSQALSMLSPKAAQAVAAASEDTWPPADGTDDAFRGA